MRLEELYSEFISGDVAVWIENRDDLSEFEEWLDDNGLVSMIRLAPGYAYRGNPDGVIGRSNIKGWYNSPSGKQFGVGYEVDWDTLLRPQKEPVNAEDVGNFYELFNSLIEFS